MPDVYRAKEPFAYTDKRGVPQSVVPGQEMLSDDPNFKGKEHLFELAGTSAHRTADRAAGVEDASADPGSLRSVSTTKRGRGRRPAEPEPVTEPVTEPDSEEPATPAEAE